MNPTPPVRPLRALVVAAALTTLSGCPGPKPTARDAAVRDVSPGREDARAVDAADDAPRVVVFDDVALPDAATQTALQAVAGSPTGTTLDLPTTESWPAVNRWNDAMEREYSEFVRAIGHGVETRRCGRLDRCLRDPQINTLYDPATEGRLTLDVDCGDLPYVLRAYFAFKRRLPYGYVDAITGSGTDPRYMLRVRPVLFQHWSHYRSPRSILRHISDAVHSGMYRVEPTQEQGDYYPVTVSRESIRPGTTYYDPNGHVLVVTEVREDGSVFLIDGHPDGSMTWKRFGEAFELGPRFLWGGFKNWRRQTWDGAAIVRATNAELPDFDANQQWTRDLWVAGIPREQWLRPPLDAPRNSVAPGMFHLWVRRTLAAPNVVRDPVRDFREQVRSLCRDVLDRADAVNVAMTIRTHQRSHPGSLPYNIYGTNGDWELYSTPSRDARLKASVREINEGILALPADSPVRGQLVSTWAVERTQPACQYTYANSVGATVALSIDAVLDRLFAISFDPYHCPELRWGAAAGSPELSSCPDNNEKLGWYRAEQRLRNQIDRHYGVATSISMGPTETPAVDFRRTLGVAPPPVPVLAPTAAR